MKRSFVWACVFLGGALAPMLAQINGRESSSARRVELRVQIDAAPDTVWRAMTNPRLVKQWFLSAETETDWRPGSPLVQRGGTKGNPFEAKGVILESLRPKRLVHTHWRANSGLPDRAENYQTVRYELAEAGEGTLLTVVEENIPDEPSRIAAEQTWGKALRGLKAIAERRRSSE